eukprot:7284312-Pyramimonas_sp.AAC.1
MRCTRSTCVSERVDVVASRAGALADPLPSVRRCNRGGVYALARVDILPTSVSRIRDASGL